MTSPPPPPPSSGWLKPAEPDGTRAACVNPAELVHDTTTITESTFDYPQMGFNGVSTDISNLEHGEVTTQFLTYPDAYEADCVTEGPQTWLTISPADPTDQRAQIPIDQPAMASLGLGLHLLDYQLLAGDLLTLTEAKIDAALVDQ